MQETLVRFLCWEDPLEKQQATPVFLSFPCGSAGKESACNSGDLGSIPGLGKSPGEGKDYPLQYYGLENFMNCMVHGVAKSQSDFHFHLDSANKLTLNTILKDDAVKVLQSICQQIWKISSGYRTGNGQFSFQSQRKALPKNAHTTAQLHSSHTVAK